MTVMGDRQTVATDSPDVEVGSDVGSDTDDEKDMPTSLAYGEIDLDDSPDVTASPAADSADVEADLGSGPSVRGDTGVERTMSPRLARQI